MNNVRRSPAVKTAFIWDNWELGYGGSFLQWHREYYRLLADAILSRVSKLALPI